LGCYCRRAVFAIYLLGVNSTITEAEIKSVVKSFYAKIRADDLLGPIFALKIRPEEWDRHESHIVDFWSSIFLKTARFKGNPMSKHAALPDLKPDHFSHWLSLFRKTVDQELTLKQAEAMHAMAGRIAKSLQMGLAYNYENMGRHDHPFQKFGIRRSHGEPGY